MVTNIIMKLELKFYFNGDEKLRFKNNLHTYNLNLNKIHNSRQQKY